MNLNFSYPVIFSMFPRELTSLIHDAIISSMSTGTLCVFPCQNFLLLKTHMYLFIKRLLILQANQSSRIRLLALRRVTIESYLFYIRCFLQTTYISRGLP